MGETASISEITVIHMYLTTRKEDGPITATGHLHPRRTAKSRAQSARARLISVAID